MNPWLVQILPNILLGISLIGLVIFAVTYIREADWRKTAPGRSLLYMVFSMIAVLSMSFVHMITGPYPGQGLVRIVVYGAMTVAIIRIVTTLYRTLRASPLYVIGIRKSSAKAKK